MNNGSIDRNVMLRRFQQTIRARKGIVAGGDGFTVALHTNGRLLYVGTNRCGQAPDGSDDRFLSIHAQGDSLVGLRADGTVCAAGRSAVEADFARGLACVRRVALGARHMAALAGNGHVRLGGELHRGHEEVSSWPAVVDVACGADFTAGLCEDGRVLVAGGSRLLRHAVSTWPRIAGIFADGGGRALYAITDTGRLLASVSLPHRTHEWRNLVFLSAAGHRLCAVTASGQLYSTHTLPTAMTEGRTFVSCAVGDAHTVAVARDGQVVATGDDRFGQCQTGALGGLFTRFEEFTIRRHEREVELDTAERAYQRRHAEATRFGAHLACSERLTACLTAYGRALTSVGLAGGRIWDNIHRISCGNAHILALCKDGRVLAGGNSVGEMSEDCCRVGAWTNVRAIVAGPYHSLGVTYDGRVCFCGMNANGQGDIGDWQNIRAVRTTDAYTVGLTYEGQLRVAGLPPFDQLLLQEIDGRVTDVAVCATHILCLLSDGRVFATLPPNAQNGRTAVDPAVAGWQHARAIAAAPGISIALCYGGTVRAAGCDAAMSREISTWRGIVAVGCGAGYVVGLGVDGRMHMAGTPTPVRKCHTDHVKADAPAAPSVSTGYAEAIANWQDIIAFACGPSHMIALNRDGQVLACGSDSDGQCSVTTHFTLFRDARALAGYGRYQHDADDEDAALPE